MKACPRFGPLVVAGILLGAGLGGFVDGIVFHQIAQVHSMLSARLPPDTLANVSVNMFWDGVFHAAVWALTVAGVVALYRAGTRPGVAWSGKVLLGASLLGWGLFNLIEGLVNHHLLSLHHVIEGAGNHLPADLAFLATGVALIVTGAWLVRSGQRNALSQQTSAPDGRPHYRFNLAHRRYGSPLRRPR